MRSSILKPVRIAAMFFLVVFLVLGLAGAARATCSSPTFPYFGGIPWQVNDIVACFENGTCNVLRNTGSGLVVLDQISDLAQSATCPVVPGVTSPGDTRGVAIDNTLHALVTDNGGGGKSNVVVYTIASLNPDASPSPSAIAHTPVAAPFDGSSGTSSNAQAVAVNGVGHIFVGNAISGGGSASIVELSPTGSSLGAFVISNAATPAWVVNNPYAVNATVLDPNGHVQKVTTAGTSGPLFPPFNQFNGQTTDGLTWQNVGPCVECSSTWVAGTFYPAGAMVVDTNFNNETALTAGTSGGGTGPTWNLNLNGITVDNAVTWNDQGSPVNGSCIENQLASLDLSANGGTVYFTSGPGGIIQTVSTPISGFSSCKVFADFGPNVTLHGIHVVPPKSMPTNCKSSVTPSTSCPNTNGGILVVATGTQFVDESGDSSDLPGAEGGDPAEFSSGQDIYDVCNGTTELTATSAPPGPPAPSDSCALLLDASTGAIVARYPVAGVNTLQSLALDPLVTDCTVANSCTSLNPPTPPTIAKFWLGDHGSHNFYSVDFATGTPSSPINANADCSSHPTCNATFPSIQGLGIYGGEGANQADLTKLASSSLTSSTNFSSFVQFPLPADLTNTNALTVTLAGSGATGSIPFALYASLVSMAAPTNYGGNNSGRTDVNARDITGAAFGTPPPCQPTTSDFTKCIVWKIDIGTGGLGAPANTAIFTKFDGPSTPPSPPAGIDNGTHVFLDEHYDVTTFTGKFDPGGGTCLPICKTFTSVWSLQEVAAMFTSNFGGSSGCFYVIGGKTIQPGSLPANNVFKSNRSTLPIEFQCPGVTPQSLFITTMNSPPGPPEISILTSGTNVGGVKSAPVAITLSTTANGKAPYRFNGTDYIFNWAPQKGIFDVCTFDPTNTIQPFCAGITVN